MDKSLLNSRLNIEEMHNQGLTGKGFKVAIWETEDADHHEVVEAVIKTIKTYCPDSEVKSFYFKGNQPIDIMEAILDWGADFCNMSFHGWNIDKYDDFIHLEKYRERYEVADRFFKQVVCIAAIGNTGRNEEVFPSATEIWDDYVMGIGSFIELPNGEYGVEGYVTINSKLDYLSNGTVWYKGSPWTGTSFAAPTITGMCTLLGENYKNIKGYKPEGHKPYYAMLDAISADGFKDSIRYAVPEMRLLVNHEILFNLNSANYTVDKKKRVIQGLKDGKMDGEIVDIPMQAIDGRTMLPNRIVIDLIKEFAPVVDIDIEWLQETAQVKISIISAK